MTRESIQPLRTWTRADVLVAFALLVAANIGMVHRQLDTPLTTVGLVTGAIAVVLAAWWAAMSGSGLRLPAGVTMGLLVLFWLVTALVNLMVPEDLDAQADRDDALDLATRELVAGRDPWAVSTQIHESHHPSPAIGGILLAAPFRLVLGDSSWQNVAWVGLALCLLVWRVSAGSALAGALLVGVSPVFWSEWIFQSDLLTLGIKFAIAMLWGLWAMRSGGGVAFVLSAALFALVLADRFIFVAFAVVVAVVALRWVPWRRAFAWLSLSGGLTIALFVIPWVLAPGYRAQMILNASKSSEAGDLVPNAGLFLGLAMVTLAAVLGWVVRDDAGLLGSACLVTALVVAWQVVLYSSSAGTFDASGSLAVAYTGIMLILGIGYLVLRRGNSLTGVAYGARRMRTDEPLTAPVRG